MSEKTEKTERVKSESKEKNERKENPNKNGYWQRRKAEQRDRWQKMTKAERKEHTFYLPKGRVYPMKNQEGFYTAIAVVRDENGKKQRYFADFIRGPKDPKENGKQLWDVKDRPYLRKIYVYSDTIRLRCKTESGTERKSFPVKEAKQLFESWEHERERNRGARTGEKVTKAISEEAMRAQMIEKAKDYTADDRENMEDFIMSGELKTAKVAIPNLGEGVALDLAEKDYQRQLENTSKREIRRRQREAEIEGKEKALNDRKSFSLDSILKEGEAEMRAKEDLPGGREDRGDFSFTSFLEEAEKHTTVESVARTVRNENLEFREREDGNLEHTHSWQS